MTTISDAQFAAGIEAANRSWRSNPRFDDAVRAAITAAAQVGKEDWKLKVLEFANAIMHGNDEHRAWLVEAADAFVKGAPVPSARNGAAQAGKEVMPPDAPMVAPRDERLAAPDMSEQQVRDWITACNHEPARRVLRTYLFMKESGFNLKRAGSAPDTLGRADDALQDAAWEAFVRGFTSDYSVENPDLARSNKAGVRAVVAMLAAAPSPPAQSGEGQDERAAFEAWLQQSGAFTDWSRAGGPHTDGDYLKPLTQRAWQTWCAAIEHGSLQREYRRTDRIATLTQALAEARAMLHYHEKWVEELKAVWAADKAKAEKAEAKLAEAEKVIAPFAKRAERFDGIPGTYSCADDVELWQSGNGRCDLTVGHLRAARAFLAERNKGVE